MKFRKTEFVLNCIYKTNSVIILFIALIGLTACIAHYPVNKSISSVKTVEDYSLENRVFQVRIRCERCICLSRFIKRKCLKVG